MDEIVEKTLDALNKRNLKAFYTDDVDSSINQTLKLIPEGSFVGLGDSTTLRQLGVIEMLKERGNYVANPFDISKTLKDQQSYFDYLFWPSLLASVCDVFLTGSNAITQDGKIVNIDGAGNRVSGMFWGHQTSIIVVGINKITKDLDDALDRIKNCIAPEHIRRKEGKTPCAKTGHCRDCRGDNRICAVTTIIEHKPITTEINVIIVNQDMGLGWDKNWTKSRIERIASNHEKFKCPLPPAAEEKTEMKELWKMARQKTRGRWFLNNCSETESCI